MPIAAGRIAGFIHAATRTTNNKPTAVGKYVFAPRRSSIAAASEFHPQCAQ
jgi:hypothetical protein